VILVAPASEQEQIDGPSVSSLLRGLLASGDISLKDAVKRVALETGLPRGEVYAEALRLKAGHPDK